MVGWWWRWWWWWWWWWWKMSGSISFSVFCCQLGAMSCDKGGLARVLLQDLDNNGEKHNIYNNKKVDQLKSKQIWLKILFEQLSILTRSSHVWAPFVSTYNMLFFFVCAQPPLLFFAPFHLYFEYTHMSPMLFFLCLLSVHTQSPLLSFAHTQPPQCSTRDL